MRHMIGVHFMVNPAWRLVPWDKLCYTAGRNYAERHAMTHPHDNFAVRSKVWVEDNEGNVIFGLGRYRILEAVGRLGSLQAAARELKMSYRAVWMRVRASEERMGRTLVEREGKGSRLTPFAENLMKQYRRLMAAVHQESDEVYEGFMSKHLP